MAMSQAFASFVTYIYIGLWTWLIEGGTALFCDLLVLAGGFKGTYNWGPGRTVALMKTRKMFAASR